MSKNSKDPRVDRFFTDLNREMASPFGSNEQNPMPPSPPVAEPAAEEAEPLASAAVSPVQTVDPICPFLKVAWDQTIKYGYPNEENFCFRPQKAHSVALVQQEVICLAGNFQACPVYQQTKGKARLPKDIHGHFSTGNGKTVLIMIISLLTLSIFILIAAFILFPF